VSESEIEVLRGRLLALRRRMAERYDERRSVTDPELLSLFRELEAVLADLTTTLAAERQTGRV
jgi:hypothetical protein